MATSIYTQDEVELMLATPKTMELDAWEGRTTDRKGSPRSVVLSVEAVDRNDMEFWVEFVKGEWNDSTHVTLKGRIMGRDPRALVRYDLHDGSHDNPSWCGSVFTGSRVPHRHVYSEESLVNDRLWDACAYPLDDLEDNRLKLVGRFIDDMNIRFVDSNTNTQLFDFMNK